MILKYATALSCVSAVEPHKRMIGLTRITNKMLNAIAAMIINTIDVLKILFASSGFSSPLLLATNAEIATFIAKNSDKPKNLGCVVRPTAATA